MCQSTWRKIQDLDVVWGYIARDDDKLFAGMLDAVAFLPVADVATELQYLTDHVPDDCNGLHDLLTYFSATYVNGTHSEGHQPPPADRHKVHPDVA